MRIVDPVSEPHASHRGLAPRLPTLDGIVLGFLVNEKGDATATDFELDSLLLEERIRAEYTVKDVVRTIKPTAFKPASLPMIESLAQQVDAVINGLAK